MAISKKGKYQSSRRQFGLAGGRHSRGYHEKVKYSLLKKEQRIRWYKDTKDFHCAPYQLLRKPYNGRIKIVVKRLPQIKEKQSKLMKVGSNPFQFKYIKNSDPVTGNRVFNIELLQDHISKVAAHTCLCEKARQLVLNGKPAVVINNEVNKKGLYTVLVLECSGCHEKFHLSNSEKIENGLYDINVRAVWGSVVSGGGASSLNETLSTMNIPPMRDNIFSSMEQTIGEWWEDALKQEMLKAGAEEKRIAIKEGSFHDGEPAITVICDGGWSKRTHKHTYNASGGVAVIFGAKTQKLLYIGVRNKQCLVCKTSENKNVEPPKHNCFSNWKQSSQSMEADILVNGFLEAESTHGVRYTKIIADGDSSVFPQLQEKVPIWGRNISKLECANHTCKCVRTNLEKLVLEKPHYKGKGKLTKLNRSRLTTALRCAIRMRSKDNNVKLLRHDILNAIYHVLGFHEKCSDFCKKKTKTNDTNTDIDLSETDPKSSEESFDDIFDEQVEYWRQPSDTEMSTSRIATTSTHNIEDLKELIQDVQIILNRVADKSHRLMGNFTTNLAESWMAIRSKFDGGKVVNRCGRGSWATRCYGGALRKNLGAAWSPLTFQNVTNSQAGQHFYQNARRQIQKLKATTKYHAKPQSKLLRSKRKLQLTKESRSKTAMLDYGSNLNDSPDVSAEELLTLCETFLSKHVEVTLPEIMNIQQKTIKQHESQIWKNERRKRLTTSNFGKVIQRRTKNISTALVKNMLYSNFKGNIHTIRDLAQEANSIIEYTNMKAGVKVEKTGLRISEHYPFLAASTDGLVTDGDSRGLLEIKNFLQTNNHLIKEAAVKVSNFCLCLKNDRLSLKRNHEIYYQIQGQLNIFEKDWCDFVLRRTNPHDMYIERIYKDEALWKKTMLPKLKCFYRKFLLPELALPRFGTYTGIRKPISPWYNNEVTCVSNQPQPSCSSTIQHTTSPEPVVRKTSVNKDPVSICPSHSQTGDITGKVTTRRRKSVKFVGRNIKHKWIVDEKTAKTKWYKGTVLQVLKGRDGEPDAVYEVLYQGEDDAHEVENLIGDLEDGSLKFTDI